MKQIKPKKTLFRPPEELDDIVGDNIYFERLKERKHMLQDLYDSEINAAISWNWDGGFEVRLGNGLYNAEENWLEKDNVKTFEEAEQWIKEKAIELYPNSVFAKNYKHNYKLPGSDEVEESISKLSIR